MKKYSLSLLSSLLLVTVGIAGLSTNAEASRNNSAIMECERDDVTPFETLIVHLFSHSGVVNTAAIGDDCAVALSKLKKVPDRCKIEDITYISRNGDRSVLYTLKCM